jgi:hypothetical protein
MKYAVLFEDNDELAHMRPLIWCLVGDNIDTVNVAFFHPKLMPVCSIIMSALGTLPPLMFQY